MGAACVRWGDAAAAREHSLLPSPLTPETEWAAWLDQGGGLPPLLARNSCQAFACNRPSLARSIALLHTLSHTYTHTKCYCGRVGRMCSLPEVGEGVVARSFSQQLTGLLRRRGDAAAAGAELIRGLRGRQLAPAPPSGAPMRPRSLSLSLYIYL